MDAVTPLRTAILAVAMGLGAVVVAVVMSAAEAAVRHVNTFEDTTVRPIYLFSPDMD